jgi:ubiquitin carboxyl-terminal hydrolase 34
MGEHEAVLLMDLGFLRKSLEIISADHLLPISPQYTRMLNIISKRVVNRPVSFDGVILLLCRLIQVCDPSVDSIPDNQERLETSLNGEPVALTIPERHLLMQHWTRGQAHILVEKLLQINQNSPATRLIIVRLLRWPESVDPYIYHAIIHGIRKGSPTIPCGPFLRAAVLYCEQSDAPRAIVNMVNYVTKVTTDLEIPEGREFLQFFKDIFELRANRLNIPEDEIRKFCFERVPQWAPVLLTYYDTIVRQETEDFVTDIILQHPHTVAVGTEGNEAAKARNIILAAQRLGIGCLEYLQNTYIHNRAQAVRSTLLSIHAVIESCSSFFDEDGQEDIARRFFNLKSSMFCSTYLKDTC